MKRSKSMLQTFLFGNDDGEDDTKCKNIRQTGTQSIYYIYACMCVFFSRINLELLNLI